MVILAIIVAMSVGVPVAVAVNIVLVKCILSAPSNEPVVFTKSNRLTKALHQHNLSAYFAHMTVSQHPVQQPKAFASDHAYNLDIVPTLPCDLDQALLNRTWLQAPNAYGQ